MTDAELRSLVYVTVNEEFKDWGLYITGAGRVKVKKNVEYPLINDPTHHYFHYSTGRRISEYQILYISKGRGEFESEATGIRKVTAGDIFVLLPGVWHRFRPDRKTGWDEYWVEFEGPLIQHCQFKEILNQDSPITTIGIHGEVIDNFMKILETVKSEKPGYQYLATGHLFNIFAQIFALQKYHVFEGKKIMSQIEQAKLFIHENFDKSISQTQVAAEVGLSYSLYRKKFKEYTNLSPCQYQISLRLNKAKGMLIASEASLTEIADKLGFESIDYFYRVFKKKTGVTPSNFRKKNRR